MPGSSTPVPHRRPRHHRWLLALPFLWQVAMIPVVNDVAWRPLSLPFPMVWQMLGIVVATAVIGVVFVLDNRSGVAAEEAEIASLEARS